LLTFIYRLLTLILLSVFVGYIPVNRSYKPDPDGVDIYVASNGIHTDFVLPINTSIKDWRVLFTADQFRKGWIYASYIAFGWGDKGFYLKTPEWKDLRLNTAVNALFVPSTSAMHVTLWPQPVEDELTIKVRLSDKEYQILVAYILDSFRWGGDHQVIEIDHPGYGEYDLFFESTLKFHLFRTCNVWTAQGLKKAGVRSSLWTPYDKPILFQISKTKS
jgi:uncharacterized protein (TIGR02117 family)